ncbi:MULTISPECIES: glutathione S-transferase family protein [Pseudomonas syringae group]|uniref:Glutathione S-transferase, N-terminal domain n=2 Tax=Pseudomonas syringae group genomosp. 3 TaxID=251701 RepID=A0A3M5U5P1_9PSED|nr:MULTISPECIES: glutathione S-transferase family protein [Pseudomonas syringae group]KPZ16366.1 Glutathione S-transferase, N-terminal domain [Pseudomonas syringae pv. viburni]POD76533.1 glutathione S-transferase [Pseudomonas syringae group genomosp. 3]RMO80052.1 Glutathione S-transferase, N-terminal domain [Pseudomonas syringae pv. primulae]RMU41239.1 Glutathione S-transferase, N-terminal domain [Pseudomonas syringae pv. primulae]
MKLLYQTHSPYARKVLVLAHELGLSSSLEVIHHETSPTSANEAIYSVNPLGKVPVLVMPDGVALFDSIVICDYLDTLHDGPRFIPLDGTERYEALRLQALAQGMCDVGIKLRWEVERRPQALRYPAYAEGQAYKLEQAFDFIEQRIDLNGQTTIGHIALATALDWIAFRELSDFSSRKRLTEWYGTFCERASMRATEYSGQTHD